MELFTTCGSNCDTFTLVTTLYQTFVYSVLCQVLTPSDDTNVQVHARGIKVSILVYKVSKFLEFYLKLLDFD